MHSTNAIRSIRGVFLLNKKKKKRKTTLGMCVCVCTGKYENIKVKFSLWLGWTLTGKISQPENMDDYFL